MKISKIQTYTAIWAVCSLPVIFLSFFLDPDKLIENEYSFMPSCLFKFVTENECIGCGFTRSMSLFAHGRLEESFSYNKMGSVIFMLILIMNILLAYKLLIIKRSKDSEELKEEDFKEFN